MLSQGFLATVHRHTRHLCVPGQGCLPISEGLAIAWRVDITPITHVAVLAVDYWLHSGAAFDGVSVAPAEQRYEERYEEATCAYGWNVEHVGDANDTERLAQAFESFRRTENVPTLIIVESHIGYGAPHKQDTSAAHGEPFGEEEVRLAKRSYGWPEDAKFLAPEGVREHFQDGLGRRSRGLHEAWITLLASYRSKYPDLADKLQRMQTRTLPDGWDPDLPVFVADAKGLATRDSSAKVLHAIAPHYPWLIGGAADLAGVVLSACNTAASANLNSEALSGLARAFFYAGARALLVSHWQVYSNAAVRLTTRAFVELEADQRAGCAEALRRAMIELMDDRGEDDNAHPAVRAPFVVVGGA